MSRSDMRIALCLFLATALCAAGVRAQGAAATVDSTLQLAGDWQFRLDPEGVGEGAAWFSGPLGVETIALPGTTDLANKGYELDRDTMTYARPIRQSEMPARGIVERFDEAGSLVREWAYVGKAWYQRAVPIPPEWAGKDVRLRLERVLWSSAVWLDARYIGTYDSLVAEHSYDLGIVEPGEHRLTVCVDNDLVHNIGLVGHAYGPETQSRWNGIVGDISLTASDPVRIERVQVYPSASRTQVDASLTLQNLTDSAVDAVLAMEVSGPAGETLGAQTSSVRIGPGTTTVDGVVLLDAPGEPWDEFATPLYSLTAEVASGDGRDSRSEQFGFRLIEREGRHILVNGRRVFLRGVLDCAVYPKTGHPPVAVDEWLRVMGTIKEYGFNHVRFHSWCPPEAAFEAADQLGVYLAPETPFWVDDWATGIGTHPSALGGDPEVTEYLRNEIRRISEAYGNHPSFALFCIGNEFGSGGTDWDLANELIAEAKERDNRRLYNASTARNRVEADDYWATHTTGIGTRGVGPGRTDWDFSAAAGATDLPVIAHETGQRPVYPDYEDLLPKFTGPLKPYNLERFLRMATENGVGDQVADFERASAWHQITQYKAEHEAMLRTADYAGYQLLMLNDFTGQSEALVGVLDPFWESKGIVAVEDVREWNAPTVLLARFSSFAWTTADVFEADIEVAHYGRDDLRAAEVGWSLSGHDGGVMASGTLDALDLPAGGLSPVGHVSIPLNGVLAPGIVYFRIGMGDISNKWKLGVYPANAEADDGAGAVRIADRLDDATIEALASGERVLLLASGLENQHTGRHGFDSTYWSAGWWGNRFSQLGVLSDTAHPALADFPTDGHSDWFWAEVLGAATSVDLTGLVPEGYRPIIQGVTDFHFNRLLGQLFELRVGEGRLMVCGADLSSDLGSRPAARQLRKSVLAYMNSDAFTPECELATTQILDLFAPPGLERLGISASADTEAQGFEARRAIDEDPTTIWHTPWSAGAPVHPHELILDLGRERQLRGLTYLPRQEQTNGRIAAYAVHVSADGHEWGPPIAKGEWPNDATLKEIHLTPRVTTRYIKLVALSEVNGEVFASVAEVGVLLSE